MYVDGDGNVVKAWQGKHENGDIDNNETGDNDIYWYVTGNNNNVASYQTDDNGNGGQYSYNDIDGNSNTVKVTQRGAGDHYSKIDINGNSNNIEVTQRGNSNEQWLDLKAHNGHTVDVFQKDTVTLQQQ